MSDERPRQRDKAAADPSHVHDEAGQDEEGHGEHGERIHPRDDLLRDDDEREIRHQDGDHCRDRERKADRHGGQNQEAEDPEEEAAHHPVSSTERPTDAGSRAGSASPAAGPARRWITISAPDTGAAA